MGFPVSLLGSLLASVSLLVVKPVVFGFGVLVPIRPTGFEGWKMPKPRTSPFGVTVRLLSLEPRRGEQAL